MKILSALIKKELLQIKHDPSALLVAFVLPLILLIVFGYGINLDNNRIKIGLVIENTTPDINSLAQAFTDSPFLKVKIRNNRHALEKQLVSERIRGMVIIPPNFNVKAEHELEAPQIQSIADGSEPNTAFFVQSYIAGVIHRWKQHQAYDAGIIDANDPLISVEPRFWYNSDLKSRNFLIPGAIAIIMTLIGTLLTALVIAREWERGTMEAILATPVTTTQILLGKLIPYFGLGICSMIICWLFATLWYGIPFRGSFIVLLFTSSVFLLAALGQGMLISSISRNQFMASQIAIMSAFLPSFMLSGFIYEISSMPKAIQYLTYLIPARYFITNLQTLFLVGNVWTLLFSCTGAMIIISFVFFALTFAKTSKRLE